MLKLQAMNTGANYRHTGHTFGPTSALAVFACCFLSIETVLSQSYDFDDTPPQLTAFDFFPKTVDVSAGDAIITVTITVFDEGSGVKPPFASASSLTTTQISSEFPVNFTLVSGTVNLGVWEKTLIISQGAAPGLWEITLFPLQDLIGNRETGFGPPPQFDNTFTVVSTGGTSDVFGGESIEGFPGWKASSWYLYYNVDAWSWIYHDEHGWQFVSENSTEAVIFLWDMGLQEWLFLNESTYRWIFLFGDNSG